jgi:hypothetical protein
METYELLTGEVLNISGLADAERAFLKQLSADAAEGADYFDLERRVKGRGALPLRGGPITPAIARSVLYRAAHDIADRVGIEQGYLLAPDVDRSGVEPSGDLLSLTEAAELIGISRPATHQALVEDRLRGQRVGNAWIVRGADAEAFRQGRSSRAGSPPSTSELGRAAGGSRK